MNPIQPLAEWAVIFEVPLEELERAASLGHLRVCREKTEQGGTLARERDVLRWLAKQRLESR